MWISQITYVKSPYSNFFKNSRSSSHIGIYSKKDTPCAIQKCVGIEENDNIVFSSVAKPTNPNLPD
jgi:hypothetical protein